MYKRQKLINQFADLSGYAEKMLVHENALVKIGNDVPFDRAALIGCGVMTGVGAALNTAKVAPGSTVAVFLSLIHISLLRLPLPLPPLLFAPF